MLQPLLVPITSTQSEQENATAARTPQTYPCRNDCLGMNTKDEAQFTRSEHPSLSSPRPFSAAKLQQEVASGEDRRGKSWEGNDRGTLGREREVEEIGRQGEGGGMA